MCVFRKKLNYGPTRSHCCFLAASPNLAHAQVTYRTVTDSSGVVNVDAWIAEGNSGTLFAQVDL